MQLASVDETSATIGEGGVLICIVLVPVQPIASVTCIVYVVAESPVSNDEAWKVIPLDEYV
jgi:hypothetical protein